METAELMSQTRAQRLAEVGTEAACPFCRRPRVLRSDYVRCLPCGVNWLAGEDLEHDPKIARFREVVRLGIGMVKPKAKASSDG